MTSSYESNHLSAPVILLLLATTEPSVGYSSLVQGCARALFTSKIVSFENRHPAPAPQEDVLGNTNNINNLNVSVGLTYQKNG